MATNAEALAAAAAWKRQGDGHVAAGRLRDGVASYEQSIRFRPDYNEAHDAEIEIRQVKYLNNVVEHDHRAIKRQVRPMMGFKSFRSAAATLAGIELMHMIRKGQMRIPGRRRPPQQFYALAN